jgi:hypothetical protein
MTNLDKIQLIICKGLKKAKDMQFLQLEAMLMKLTII